MSASRKRDPKTYAIIGAAMEVHKELGNGFLEPVYHEALAVEFTEQQIPFVHEVDIPIYYKNHPLKTVYRADFICFDTIVVEIKAAETIHKAHQAQTIHYLTATKLEIGLLLNFGKESLEYKRFIKSKK